jgi:hypothetical protein
MLEFRRTGKPDPSAVHGWRRKRRKNGTFAVTIRRTHCAIQAPNESPPLALERDLKLVEWMEELGYDEV